jgi:hypothetical protein
MYVYMYVCMKTFIFVVRDASPEHRKISSRGDDGRRRGGPRVGRLGANPYHPPHWPTLGGGEEGGREGKGGGEEKKTRKAKRNVKEERKKTNERKEAKER